MVAVPGAVEPAVCGASLDIHAADPVSRENRWLLSCQSGCCGYAVGDRIDTRDVAMITAWAGW